MTLSLLLASCGEGSPTAPTRDDAHSLSKNDVHLFMAGDSLDKDALRFLREQVWLGLATRAEIEEGAIELLAGDDDYPGDSAIRAATTRVLVVHAFAQAAWVMRTDADSLVAAFRRMEAAGIIARHSSGATRSDGANEIADQISIAEARGRSVRGYVYYTDQDAEQLLYGPSYAAFNTTDDEEPATGQLSLAWGHLHGGEAELGNAIVEALRAEGLNARWTGSSPHSEITVLGLDWRARRAPDTGDPIPLAPTSLEWTEADRVAHARRHREPPSPVELPDGSRCPRCRTVGSYVAETWTMGMVDAGEPPSFFLPLGRGRAGDVRNGFGWLSVDDHVIWLNHSHRDRAGTFGPPISLAVMPDELCAPDVREMLGSWDGEPYALELLNGFTAEQMRCLRGLHPRYVSAQGSSSQGQSYCDLLVEEELLSTELRGLAVNDCSTESVRALARFDHLELLFLDGSLANETVAALGELRGLRSLWLSPRQSEADVLTSLAGLTVERLALSSSYTPSEADLDAIGRMPALTELFALTPTARPRVWPVPASLHSLDVMALDEEGLRRVCASERIRELRVGIAEAITDEALECLSGRESLEVLRLGRAPLSAAGMEVIGTLTGLRELGLSGASIRDLAPLRRLRGLRVLRLSGTGISDEDLAVIAELPELRTLVLSRTEITNLAPLRGLAHLHLLDASFTGVGDDSLSTVRSLAELHELRLHQSEVSPAGMARLQTARPDVLAWGPGDFQSPSR